MIKLCRVRQQIGSGATIQMMGESVFRIHIAKHILMFSSGQSLSQVRLFATPWTAVHQASLSITNSQSLLKLMSIELVKSSNHLHHILASGQITGREHSPALQQKIGLKIYWACPCPSKQDPVSPSVNLSHQEVSISLLSFSIRGQTE